MAKAVNISTVCFIWLVSLIGLQNVYAQMGQLSKEDKEIYAKALAGLKFDNAYSKRFGITPRLFNYISFYTKGSPKNPIISYIRANKWLFVEKAAANKITGPTNYFYSKKLVKHRDSVIKFDKTDALNIFSPVMYDLVNNRAAVVFEHNHGNGEHKGYYNFGIVFFEKQNNKWILIKNISQFEIID